MVSVEYCTRCANEHSSIHPNVRRISIDMTDDVVLTIGTVRIIKIAKIGAKFSLSQTIHTDEYYIYRQ